MVERLGALRHRTFRSLAERNYRRFVVGHTSSVIGTWMQRIGQDWLILELTDSAVALGLSCCSNTFRCCSSVCGAGWSWTGSTPVVC